jgi:AcrR family transcriptional regulator
MRRRRREETTDLSRDQRKQRTREALMDAALTLIGRGTSFTGLGLREVTREAGVVPTAFYRHFRDMDELGLALVEEGGVTLRRMLREARQGGVPLTNVIRNSVRIYVQFLRAHPREFLFVAGERSGGSVAIRAAVRREISHFGAEMAQDLRNLNVFPQLSMPTLQMICGLVVNTMISAAGDILDLPPKQPRAEEELIDNFVRQLRLIFLGAAAWKETTKSSS